MSLIEKSSIIIMSLFFSFDVVILICETSLLSHLIAQTQTLCRYDLSGLSPIDNVNITKEKKRKQMRTLIFVVNFLLYMCI
jgi:hypothetical protein